MSDNVVCPYYSVGFCKFKDQCLKEHPKEDCHDVTCNRIGCLKRHKRLCKYGTYCKRHIRSRSCEFRHMTAEPLDNKKELTELTEELKEYKDSVLKLKLEVSELQSMNTEKAKLLKTFTTKNLISSKIMEKEEKEDCANCKETNLIKSDLVQLASKYHKLLAEYTKTKNLLNVARKELLSNKNTKESTVKCIKGNVCDLTLKTDSGLKVHTDPTHRNVSGSQGKVECSHCLEKFSDLTLMKKHNKREHRFPCKQCPKTFKEKLTLNMHKNTYHLEKNVDTRNSLTPTSGALSLDTAPPASKGSGGN